MARKRPRASSPGLPEDVRMRPVPATTRAEDLAFFKVLPGPDIEPDPECEFLPSSLPSPKERRKALLDRLRDIDARKAALAAAVSSSGTCNDKSSNALVPLDVEITPSQLLKDLHSNRNLLSSHSPESNAADHPRSSEVPALLESDSQSKPNEGSLTPMSKPLINPGSGTSDTVKGQQNPVSVRRTPRSRTPVATFRSALDESPFSKVVYSGLSKCQTLAFSKKLINAMLRDPTTRAFSAPVVELWPPEAIPRYSEVVKEPMDLGTIKRKLDDCSYILPYPSGQLGVSNSPLSHSSSPTTVAGIVTPHISRKRELAGFIFDIAAFCGDVRLCFRNCMNYCGSRDLLYTCAKSLMEQFDLDICAAPPAVPILRNRRPSKRKRPKKNIDLPIPHSAQPNDISSVVDDLSSEEDTDDDDDSDANTNKRASKSSGQDKQPSNSGKDKVIENGTSSLSPMERIDRNTGNSLHRLRDLKQRLSYLLQCRTVVKARSNVSGICDTPMTFKEKSRLTDQISRLPVTRIGELVEIVSSAVNRDPSCHNDEIEIDLDKLDSKILREIEAFVHNDPDCKVKIGEEFEGLAELEAEIASVSAQFQHVKANCSTAKAGGLWESSSSSSSSDSNDSDSSSGSSEDCSTSGVSDDD